MPLARPRSFAPGVRAAALLVALAACTESTPTGLPSPATGITPRAVVAPAAFNGNIRIGVVPAAAAATIGTSGAYTSADKVTGAALLTGTGGTATVTLASGSVSVTNWRLQVMCSGDAAVATRRAAAEAAGYVTYTQPVPASRCTRLFLGAFPLS